MTIVQRTDANDDAHTVDNADDFAHAEADAHANDDALADDDEHADVDAGDQAANAQLAEQFQANTHTSLAAAPTTVMQQQQLPPPTTGTNTSTASQLFNTLPASTTTSTGLTTLAIGPPGQQSVLQQQQFAQQQQQQSMLHQQQPTQQQQQQGLPQQIAQTPAPPPSGAPGDHMALGDYGMALVASAAAACRPASFWRAKPRVWFDQFESLMEVHRVSSDNMKFHLTVSALDADTLTTVSDIYRSPPATDKYKTLKEAILERLTDSPDKQLNTLLHEIQLGDQKPSELYRRMYELAEGRAPEDVLRLRWLSLLPSYVQNVLKIFKSQSLSETISAADQLMETPIGMNPFSVNSTSAHTTSSPLQSRSPSPGVYATQHQDDPEGIRILLAQLIGVSREILGKVSANNNNNYNHNNSRGRGRGRSNSRSYSGDRRSRSSSANPQSGCACWYHRIFGTEARQCKPPCSFSPNPHNQQQRQSGNV